MKGQGRMDLAGDLVKASDTQGTIADTDAAPLPSPTAQNSAVKARSLAAGQVDRIVAAAVPAGMHVARDARIAMQKAATISLLYLSCLADDEHSRESRRRVTLSANDIKTALKAGGMGHLVPLLPTGQVKRGR
ncbi:hypothetical protein, conserved [Trypanosoma brucei gambiense DAL972]|uniref:Transcription factor CBF/NF-Y/archaeal histone domain-containing protein n=1 Tax=Trypanosoma brucei gambiense (strain MHOM/CI/86/DAL972) TaxID=679716 RepID=D0AA70_TRYB9|nr:hypothetical protein, conserved [Trypanosoma brucei gambiense DAL972]CBH18571.1 hypothetical protein, conserved [Trypanosoma brucei gambiense DAL972]|eukprot:XP_011780835.1 hypothetical protein, conserved [Trypanosoma brucei gambiense DAL972]